jgi:hypothetical protein
MDGPLSRKSAVCIRDRGHHAIFSSRQKSPQTTWESVVLSGFPTAGEPSLSCRLRPGTAPVLCLRIGREANCHCHGMTSRRSLSSHVQSFPPPPGPDVPL